MLLTLLFSFIFLICSIAISIIFIYFFFTTKTKRRYTLKSIFWPFKKEYTLSQNFGNLIICPIAWFIIISSIAILLFLTLLNSLSAEGVVGVISYFMSGIAAYFFSTFYLLILYYADFVEREPPHYIVQLFLWGIASALFSLVVSLVFGGVLELCFPAMCLTIIGAVTVAPLVEEFFKSLGVTFVVFTPEVDNAVDGALYGAAVGLGFAFIENWLYFTSAGISNSVAWLLLVLLRGFLSTLGHLVFTGTIGAILGWIKFKFKHWYLFAIPIFSVGIIIHSAFNFIATVVEGLMMFVLGFPFPIFLFSFLIIVLIPFTIFYVVSVFSQKRKKDGK